MRTYIKVTYIAIDNETRKPILSADSFTNLQRGLDVYFGVDRANDSDAKYLGFMPYDSKYPDDYEGYFTYTYTFNGELITEQVSVYCIEFYPQTKYEAE